MSKLSLCLLAMAWLPISASAQLKSTPLTGTWRIKEVKISGPKARTVTGIPGLLIFTGNYYSRMYIASDQPRSAVQDQTKATAAELLAVWGPFTAASGTYEISGNTLNCRPMIAKNPQVMAPGVVDVYSFTLEGNTLAVTDLRNANGPVANPATIIYTKIE
jgi:hypothetical protein